MNDHRDRLIDVLLAAEAGGDVPPDLAGRILARLPGRRPACKWAAGIAAALLLGAAAFWMMQTYRSEPDAHTGRGQGPATTAPARRIVAGTPTVVAKPAGSWNGRARIVGLTRGAPAFTVAVYNDRGKFVQSAQCREGAGSYELQWLDPGVYTVQVTAAGYPPLRVENLRVGANQDLQVDLDFTHG